MGAHIVQFGWGLSIYLLLCGLAFLTGRGLLQLLRLQVPERAGVLLAPVMALGFWTLVLGISGALRLPVKVVTPWLWGTTVLLACAGLRRPWPSPRAAGALLFCALLPVIAMERYFWFGIDDHIGSVAPDGWCNAAFGQYLWDCPRGQEGGLTPLYEFVSALSRTRYLAPSFFGFLSPLVRSGETDAVTSLFQAWTLFNMTCAVAFFWNVTATKTWTIVVATLLSTLAGWITNLVGWNNFDNSQALAYLPACAGIVQLMNPRARRWWVLLGGLLAGSLYTYPELFAFIFGGTGLMVLARGRRERRAWPDWLRGIGIGVGTAVLVLLPAGTQLIAYGTFQFRASQDPAKPGNGAFRNLFESNYQPEAFWGLGAEHPVAGIIWRQKIAGFLLSATALVGLFVLARNRQEGLSATAILLVAGAIYLIAYQKYTYGAYKLIVLNWWCLIAAAVTGAEWILTVVQRPILKGICAVVLAGTAVVLVSQSKRTDAGNRFRTIDPSLASVSLADFRQARAVKPLIGAAPVLIAADNWVAYQWAVYYLRDTPIYLHHYLSYMLYAEPQVRRGPIPPLEQITWMLTDLQFDRKFKPAGWKRVWSGTVYRLWRCETPAWAILTDIQNATDLEPSAGGLSFALGPGATTLEVLANRPGTLQVSGSFPAEAAGRPERPRITTATGHDAQGVRAEGNVRFFVPVHSGKNRILLHPAEGPALPHDARSESSRIRVQNLTVALMPADTPAEISANRASIHD